MRNKATPAVLTSLFAILGVIGLMGTALADAHRDDKGGGNKGRLSAQLEIESLMSCYAYSFDAIARATNAVEELGNLFSEVNVDNDPNYAEGLSRFRGCTTEDWFIEAFLADGTQILAEGDIPPGALPWVNLVNLFARGDGQVNTQHLFGSFSNTVDGRHGRVTAYAVITTYFDGSGIQPEGSTTGTSTYKSDVVFKRGKWLLKKTTLIIN